MKFKRVAAIVLALLLCVMFTGCDEAIETNLGTTINTENIEGESLHIRDKDPLYTQYDNTEIVTMYLTVTRGNAAEGTDHTWEEINTYSVYDYDRMGVERYKVAGLLQVGDENGLIEGELGYGQVAPNCIVQIRGQSSSRNAQKNYKIELKDNKGDWRGQTTIALNKHQGDGLRFRNKLAFDLLTGLEQIMSLRTTFVKLYVKDLTESDNAKFQDYGIFTQVEQLNKTALKAHGLDHRGHLYKVNYCEFYRYEDVIMLKDDPNYNQKAFEEILEIKGDDDHTKLITLLDKINDYSIPIEDILNEHFDIENITYWMAFNILVGNIDTQSRNFYIYSAQNSDRWYILPWDIDGMLRRTEYDILGRSDHQYWESGASNYWGNVFFQRCLKSEYYREELQKAMNDVYKYLSTEEVTELINTYAQLLKPYIYSGRDKLYAPLTKTNFDKVVKGISGEFKTNYELYRASLQNPQPFYIGVPQSKNGKFTVEWEASFDFNGEDVTYTFELARDYNFKNPIIKKEGLVIPLVEFDKLPKGQYFMRVSSKNSSGKTQYAFDYYLLDTGKIYGTKCFYVDKNGKIVEDVYVEA